MRPAYLFVLLAFFAPAGARALGLGAVDIHSGLNQPLDMDVALALAPGEDVRTLHAGLADAEDFRRAGLELSPALTGLSFAVIRPEQGAPYVHITSQQTQREPFLSFLLEVTGGGLRMQKDVTALLDPPSPRPAVARALAPFVPSPPPAAAPLLYGPVVPGESLWSIAAKHNGGRPPTADILAALLRDNPDAFARGRATGLKPGAYLKVPQAMATQVQPTQPLTLLTAKAPAAAGDVALEVADTVRLENEDIRRRLADMERQVSDLQRLLALKEEEIAAAKVSEASLPVSAPNPAPVAAPSTLPVAPPPSSPPVTPSPSVPPPAEDIGFFETHRLGISLLAVAGLVAMLGLSLIRQRRLAAAASAAPPPFSQPEWSGGPFDTVFEQSPGVSVSAPPVASPEPVVVDLAAVAPLSVPVTISPVNVQPPVVQRDEDRPPLEFVPPPAPRLATGHPVSVTEGAATRQPEAGRMLDPGVGQPASPAARHLSSRLDLAQAFLQLGDEEAARPLLEEVLAGDDPALGRAARAMLDELGGSQPRDAQ